MPVMRKSIPSARHGSRGRKIVQRRTNPPSTWSPAAAMLATSATVALPFYQPNLTLPLSSSVEDQQVGSIAGDR